MNMWEFLNDNWFWFAIFVWIMFSEWLNNSRLEDENERLEKEIERLKSRLDEKL